MNHVGVNLNTSSLSLLTYVAGIGPGLARAIVDYRKEKGIFKTRDSLKQIPRFSERVFQQCAGFLRVPESTNYLENTGVHPEAYQLTDQILSSLNIDYSKIKEEKDKILSIDHSQFQSENFGSTYISDLLKELVEPQRDPRTHIDLVEFKDDVTKIEDLKPDMELTGVVTNITNFGAFVDIGVGQVGLVHLSEITHKFIKTPGEVLSIGQRVKVKVIELDVENKRIGLSMKIFEPQVQTPRENKRNFEPRKFEPRNNQTQNNQDANRGKKFHTKPRVDEKSKKKKSKKENFNTGLADALSNIKIS